MPQYIYMSTFGNTPPYVWLIALVCALSILGSWFFIALDIVKPQPLRRIRKGDTNVELWVRERRMPNAGEAIIVPVAPDLKMAVGIAKWVRDVTAQEIQREAERAAPLPPGEAFVGKGGKFRFGLTALAVVMDDQKRTSPAWIADAVSRAIRLCRAKGADVIILPDFTEDLLRQPQTITEEQRRQTAAPIARAMLEGVLAEEGTFETVRIWVWRKEYQGVYAEELDRIAEGADKIGDLAHA